MSKTKLIIFRENQMSEKPKGSEYYNHFYKISEAYRGTYKNSPHYVLWTQVIRLLKEFPSPKILEIGCGTGQLACYLYDEGFRDYHGFDFSVEAIKIAKSKSPQSFSIGDAFNNESYNYDYNVVLATEVLEHIDDDMSVLDNIRENTTIIFTLPTRNDPAHLRIFKKPRQIRKRYYTKIGDMSIVPIAQWFVCCGTVKKFEPKTLNSILKTRSQIDLRFIIKNLTSPDTGSRTQNPLIINRLLK
jgi:SAM-dependent methyltransferase